MIVIGLDPGYRESAIVIYNGLSIHSHDICPNEVMFDRLEYAKNLVAADAVVLVLEQMQMFKSAFGVGVEVFDSVFWSGMFAQAWKPRRYDRIIRSKVRGHLGCSKGGDAAIRQALINRFGAYKEVAIGKKSKPGPLYGISSHEWSALAIAVTWYDLFGHLPVEVRPGVQPDF